MSKSDLNYSGTAKVRELLLNVKSLDNETGNCEIDGIDEVDCSSFQSIDGIAVHTSDSAEAIFGASAAASNFGSNSIDRDMKSEVDRLATFKRWPNSSPMNPTTLARAGFFYTGCDDMVQCFFCNGKIKDWEFGDSAIGEHKRFFPKCKFVQGKDQKNQPLLLNRTTSGKPEPKPSKEDDLYNPKKDFQIHKEKQISNEFKSEYRRLLSFQNWPRTHPMLPRSLANAGFYYTETRDMVKCFACSGEISDWKTTDVPMTQHTVLFPECPFIQGEDVGNEKLTTLDVMNAQHAIVYPEHPTQGSATSTKLPEKGQITQTAKVIDQWSLNPGRSLRKQLTRAQHPQFSNEAERLKTYQYWPPTAPNATLLVKAGFFHTGENDNVKCFYCNGGLRNWEPCDDPWTEHAKWFPKCDWLLQQRGEPFVQYVITNFPVPNQNLPLSPPPPSPALPSAGLDTVQGTARPVVSIPQVPVAKQMGKSTSAKSIESRMESDIVRFVIEMGFSKKKIRRIIESQVRRNEAEFQSIQTLVDAVLAAPDEPGDNEEEPTGMAAGETHTNPKNLNFKEEEAARAAYKAKMVDEPSKLNEKMDKLKISAAIPEPESFGYVTLEDEASLPSSIQDELRELRDKRICKICMDNEINVLFTPCGHLVACESCAGSVRLCPICRVPIKTCIKTYLS